MNVYVSMTLPIEQVMQLSVSTVLPIEQKMNVHVSTALPIEQFAKKKKKKKKKPSGQKNREARPTALQPISVITRRVVAGHDCIQ